MFNKNGGEIENGEQKDKTPLQDEKQEIVDEIVESKAEPKKAGVKKGTTRKPYKKRGRPKIEKIIEPEYTPENAETDSNFLAVFINEFRTGAGISVMNPQHEIFFKASSKQMFIKYGSTTSRWMPEIMFTGSLLFILVDTYKELQVLKARQKPKIKEVKTEIKTDLPKTDIPGKKPKDSKKVNLKL